MFTDFRPCIPPCGFVCRCSPSASFFHPSARLAQVYILAEPSANHPSRAALSRPSASRSRGAMSFRFPGYHMIFKLLVQLGESPCFHSPGSSYAIHRAHVSDSRPPASPMYSSGPSLTRLYSRTPRPASLQLGALLRDLAIDRAAVAESLVRVAEIGRSQTARSLLDFLHLLFHT